MIWWRLIRWVVVRGILSGVVLGTLFGTVLGSLYLVNGYALVCAISMTGGAVVGGVLGGIFGLIDGLLLALLTWYFFNPPRSLHRYRWIALLLTVICVMDSSLLAGHLLFSDSVIVVVSATILATIIAGYFTWRLPDYVAKLSIGSHNTLAGHVLLSAEK
jgi:hypothetical protein